MKKIYFVTPNISSYDEHKKELCELRLISEPDELEGINSADSIVIVDNLKGGSQILANSKISVPYINIGFYNDSITEALKYLEFPIHDFSIVSNKCEAGWLYSLTNTPYNGPFSWGGIDIDEYVKFLEDKRHLEDIELGNVLFHEAAKLSYTTFSKAYYFFNHHRENSLEEISEMINKRVVRYNKDKNIIISRCETKAAALTIADFNLKNHIIITKDEVYDPRIISVYNLLSDEMKDNSDPEWYKVVFYKLSRYVDFYNLILDMLNSNYTCVHDYFNTRLNIETERLNNGENIVTTKKSNGFKVEEIHEHYEHGEARKIEKFDYYLLSNEVRETSVRSYPETIVKKI